MTKLFLNIFPKMRYLHYLFVFLVLVSFKGFSGETWSWPPEGYWPENNATNPQGSGPLEGIWRYNFDTPIPTHRLGPGTFISIVYDKISGCFGWAISNGRYENGTPGNYCWPVDLEGNRIPAQITVPGNNGHSWICSMMGVEPGIQPGVDNENLNTIAGGVFIDEDGNVVVKTISRSGNLPRNKTGPDGRLSPEDEKILRQQIKMRTPCKTCFQSVEEVFGKLLKHTRRIRRIIP